jgi:hypothetical protein
MIMIRNMFLLFAIFLICGSSISAEKSSLNVWKDCGIGAIIFDEQEDRQLAAITNILFGPYSWSTASSSKSSGTCSGSGKVAAATFIHETYGNVVEETAKGNGAHLTAILDLMECDPVVHESIISNVQAELISSIDNVTYLSQSRLEKAEAYFNVVDGTITESYGQFCSAI